MPCCCRKNQCTDLSYSYIHIYSVLPGEVESAECGVQFPSESVGVIILPLYSINAAHSSTEALNTLFCDFCLGSNEA